MDFKKTFYSGFLLILAVCSFYFSVKKRINVVFIGDSITQGESAETAPPVFANAFLENKLGTGEVKFSNQGVSGCTTTDFLPSTATHFRDVAKAADDFYADKQATLIFSIMLGTNDSAIEGPLGSPVSSDSYRNNMKTIIDRLLNDYPGSKVIIHYPIWYSPNTYNRSKYLQEGLTRLQSYFPVIEALVKDYSKTNPGQVFTGDKKAFRYFKEHHLTHMLHENGQQGIFFLHPNETGSHELGKFWGRAISKIANQQAVAVNHRGPIKDSPDQNGSTVRIPNFNDNFKRQAPDMVSVEK
jgi:lysophospholipase L1-like esterase